MRSEINSNTNRHNNIQYTIMLDEGRENFITYFVAARYRLSYRLKVGLLKQKLNGASCCLAPGIDITSSTPTPHAQSSPLENWRRRERSRPRAPNPTICSRALCVLRGKNLLLIPLNQPKQPCISIFSPVHHQAFRQAFKAIDVGCVELTEASDMT